MKLLLRRLLAPPDGIKPCAVFLPSFAMAEDDLAEWPADWSPANELDDDEKREGGGFIAVTSRATPTPLGPSSQQEMDSILIAEDISMRIGDQRSCDTARREYRESVGVAQSAVINHLSRRFDAIAYLRHVHRSTSFRSLQSAIVELEGKVQNQDDRMRELVRDNFGRFLSCKAELDKFSREFHEAVLMGFGGQGLVGMLEFKYQSLREACTQVYMPQIERHVKVDAMVAASETIKRHRDALMLPVLLRSAMQDGEWGRFIVHYDRAKAMVSSSSSRVFQAVWVNVQSIVLQARDVLLQKFASPSVRIDSVTQLISMLKDMGFTDDPPPALLALESCSQHICIDLGAELQAFQRLCEEINMLHRDHLRMKKDSTAAGAGLAVSVDGSDDEAAVPIIDENELQLPALVSSQTAFSAHEEDGSIYSNTASSHCALACSAMDRVSTMLVHRLMHLRRLFCALMPEPSAAALASQTALEMKVAAEYVRVAGEISSKALVPSAYRGIGNAIIIHMITSTHQYFSAFGSGNRASSIDMSTINHLTGFASSLAVKLVKLALDHVQGVIFNAAHLMYLKRPDAVQLEEHSVAVPERSSSILASVVQYLAPAISVNPQLCETVWERVEEIMLMLLDCMATGVLNSVRTSEQIVDMLRDARYTRDFMLPTLQKSCNDVLGNRDTSASALISDAAGELELLVSCAFSRPVVANVTKMIKSGFTGSPMFAGALCVRDYVPQVSGAVDELRLLWPVHLVRLTLFSFRFCMLSWLLSTALVLANGRRCYRGWQRLCGALCCTVRCSCRR
jgi:hypothetical protein